MLPPVLEIYVVWHPSDVEGHGIAIEFIEHFRGTAFTGLIGGAVEVFVRSEGWKSKTDCPRPIPFSRAAEAGEIARAEYIAVVPILGAEFASEVEAPGAWRTFAQGIVDGHRQDPRRVGIFPYRLSREVDGLTVLGAIFRSVQTIAAHTAESPFDSPRDLRCRDLSQGLAQFLDGAAAESRLTAFISHTKHSLTRELGEVSALVDLVRDVIGATHLQEFFDASDLQPGTDWTIELQSKASTSALLALRTDLYPSRSWCQREVLVAKRAGMPVIILDGIGYAEERGSFLMDHVPRVPIRMEGSKWLRRDVYRALNLLVNECLKRMLWKRQQELAEAQRDLDVSWWAPHAPEPVTLVDWLETARKAGKLPTGRDNLRILHPDPPLGPDEKAVLEQILKLGGVSSAIDVMTPRQLAARGG